MNNPFTREPLKEFITVPKPEKKSNEHIFFLAILAVFVTGLLVNLSPEFTGGVISGRKSEILNQFQIINQSTNLSYTLNGSVTSVRISGEFIGNGSARIYLGDKLVVNYSPVSQEEVTVTSIVAEENITLNETTENESSVGISNLITGNVVAGIGASVEVINETTTENNTSVLINQSESNSTVIIEDNSTTNISEEINETVNLENVTINQTVENITFVNITNITSEENITQNISVNLTEPNITVNVSEPVNVTLNQTEINDTVENITQPLNDTIVNVSEEINETILNLTQNITQNITLNETLNQTNVTLNVPINQTNITLNITEVNVTENVTIDITTNLTGWFEDSLFNNYCQETCNLTNVSDSITLVIELDNVMLNLTSISYTYVEEDNQTQDIVTETNTTLNLSGLSAIEILNYSLTEKGFEIYNYTEGDVSELKLGFGDRTIIELTTTEILDLDINVMNLIDTRFEYPAIELNNFVSADLTFIRDSYDETELDKILECVQYELGECLKWKNFETEYNSTNESVRFSVDRPGVYTFISLKQKDIEYTGTEYVYFNSNCWGCYRQGICDATEYCVAQNQANRQFTFNAQFNFDILELNRASINDAEICAYSFDRYDDKSTSLFVKDSDYTYCGDISNYNRTSSLVSQTRVDLESGWVCIPVTEILLDSLEQGYSNLFIDWMGEDVRGGEGPYNCYKGITDLSHCENENPSEINDCRPYLHVEYK